MGSWWSGLRGGGDSEGGGIGSEFLEAQSNPSMFRYPPKSGTYFGSHFIMGGERFETPQPEQYLFGDNQDLNFLGSKPIPFPYPAPQSSEPTKTLKALVNIRKETLKLVKVQQGQGTMMTTAVTDAPKNENKGDYNIEFVFDADCRCEITIAYFCTEEVTPTGLVYKPRDSKLTSEPLRFKAGANQVYSNSQHIFRPQDWPEHDLQFDWDKEVFPLVITVTAVEGDEPRQCHATTASVDKYSDGSFGIKPLKQKLFVDGLVYLLQEIYGIENKHTSRKVDDDDEGENAAECVICMSDARDTLILPCRHLCLCHACADSLRYQANNCPICRAPFRALLQIRAVYRIPPPPVDYSVALPSDMPVIQMNAIPGYEMVPLLEALNGPYQPSDITLAVASLSRQEVAARTLNSSQDPKESNPIAMRVMSTVVDEPDEEDESALSTSRRSSRSGKKLPKSVSAETKTPTTSDPEEDSHFCEAAESLPDLEEFSPPSGAASCLKSANFPRIVQEQDSEDSGRKFFTKGASRFPTARHGNNGSSNDDEEKEDSMKLESIECSPTHSTNVLMIDAVDAEFSDEEDTRRTKAAASHRQLSGEARRPSESSQSTPKHQGLKNRSRSAGVTPTTSLPSTPNPRTQSASTRSSGDSFNSASSTKQLLPNTGLHRI